MYDQVKRPKGASAYILTGPIYVEERPGDTLEVRVLDIKFRVPYGVNNMGPGKGKVAETADGTVGEVDSY